MKQPGVIRIVVLCSTNYPRVIAQITTSMRPNMSNENWCCFYTKDKLNSFYLVYLLNTKQKNCTNVAALLPQNNMTACTCMLGTEISFQVHIPKKFQNCIKFWVYHVPCEVAGNLGKLTTAVQSTGKYCSICHWKFLCFCLHGKGLFKLVIFNCYSHVHRQPETFQVVDQEVQCRQDLYCADEVTGV